MAIQLRSISTNINSKLFLKSILLQSLVLGLTQFTSAADSVSCQRLLSRIPEKLDILSELHSINKDTDSKIDIVADPFDHDTTQLGAIGQEILNGLNQHMIGHEDVKLGLAKAIQRSQTNTRNPNKPVGVFLLLGITGVGKTMTAEALAETLTGNKNNFIKLDGGELQKDHEISKVIGAPPGFVGHNATPPRINAKRLKEITSEKYGINIVLVDEIEKASDALQKLLLGVMDKGEITTGSNETIAMKNTIFIFTSNLGQHEMNAVLAGDTPRIGFAPATNKQIDPKEQSERVKKAAMKSVRSYFSPEFVNRLDKVFVFNKLTDTQARQVLDHNLATVQREVFFQNADKGILFTLTADAKEFLLENGYEPEYGGRSIRRSIDHLVVDPITNLIATGNLSEGDVVQVDLNESGHDLTFKTIARGLTRNQQIQLYEKIYDRDYLAPKVEESKAGAYENSAEAKVTVSASELATQQLLMRYRDYKIWHDQVDKMDNLARMAAIESFMRLKSVVWDYRMMFDVINLIPKRMEIASANGTYFTSLLQETGAGNLDWDSMPIEPRALVLLHQSLKRTDYMPREFQQDIDTIARMTNRYLQSWLSTQQLNAHFKDALKNLFKSEIERLKKSSSSKV